MYLFAYIAQAEPSLPQITLSLATSWMPFLGYGLALWI